MCHYIMSFNGYTLWQKGQYHYEIDNRKGYSRVLMVSCEEASDILMSEY